MRGELRRQTSHQTSHQTGKITLDTRRETELSVLRQRLMRQARLAVHDAAHAEDLVQDTLVAVLQQWSAYRGDAALSTWAIAILRHKVADWYRSPTAKRERQLPDEDEASLDAALADQFDESGHGRESAPEWQQPDQAHEHKQMMQTLDGCLSCLPAQTRRVFMMREWFGGAAANH